MLTYHVSLTQQPHQMGPRRKREEESLEVQDNLKWFPYLTIIYLLSRNQYSRPSENSLKQVQSMGLRYERVTHEIDAEKNKQHNTNISTQYITEAGANLMASRVFWLILVLAAAGIGIHWSLEVVGEVEQIYQSPDYVACLI